jgi:hypothetical protein
VKRGLLLALLLLPACVPAAWRKAKAMEGRYLTGSPGEGWAPVPPGAADKAWFNDHLGASIYTDSNCGPRYQEERIEDLSTEWTVGFRNLKLLKEDYVTVGDRQGILRVQSGTLDGVPVQLGLLVANKNACNYDFVYISPPPVFEQGWDAYQAVYSGFKSL